jgi:hypothetical protein
LIYFGSIHSRFLRGNLLERLIPEMSLLAREGVPSNVINDQDQGALATIAAAVGITTVAILLCMRLLMRWPWQSLFGWDDTAVLVASVSITWTRYCEVLG